MKKFFSIIFLMAFSLIALTVQAIPPGDIVFNGPAITNVQDAGSVAVQTQDLIINHLTVDLVEIGIVVNTWPMETDYGNSIPQVNNKFNFKLNTKNLRNLSNDMHLLKFRNSYRPKNSINSKGYGSGAMGDLCRQKGYIY